jgi:cobalt/nickel transport system permease protein
MHIQDGVLGAEVCALTGVISLGAVGYSLYKLKDSLADRTIPMTGMMSALIFAGQMVNFPLIAAPVSGHLIGGVLAAVVLGPWAGCLALTLVLFVQCLLFADGGIAALGANVLHMAVIGSLGGYAVYSAIRRLLGNGLSGTIAGAVTASWLSVMAAAALFCIEFRLSHDTSDYNFTNIFTLMVSVHSLIGIGEALITGVVVSFILSQRRDLVFSPSTPSGIAGSLGRFSTAGMMCALALAAFLAPFASDFPDGLNAVAEKSSFDNLQTDSEVFAFTEYSVPLPLEGWQESERWQKVSVSLAGILGTLAVLLISTVLGRTLKLRSSSPAGSNHVEYKN